MTTYIANPIVNAFRINAVFRSPTDPDVSKTGLDIILSRDWRVEPKTGQNIAHKGMHLGPEMCARYIPEVGDYYVVQFDGYAYIEPKEVFRQKYKKKSDNQ